MKIKSSYSRGESVEPMEIGDSIDIMASDGRPHFTIRFTEDGGLRVSSGMTCRHNGILYDDSLIIAPVSSNVVQINKPVYKMQDRG